MVACALMGYITFLANVVPRQYIQSRWQLLKITVLACVFCSSVVLGNISLKYIPVSFNQVGKGVAALLGQDFSLSCSRGM